MPLVKVNDINMYYEIHGQGLPLAFVSGLSGTTDWFLSNLPTYARHFMCIVFDNRGAGRTDAPDNPYSTGMMADDLAGLLDVLDVDRAHVVGHSLGGCIAQQFAICYPERVDHLILIATSCGGPHSVPQPEIDWSDPEALCRGIYTQAYLDANPGAIRDLTDRMQAMFTTPGGLVGITHQAEASVNHDTYDKLPKITASTLVLAGDSDGLVLPENAAILAARIPNARSTIVPSAGHSLIEAEEVVVAMIIGFLEGDSDTGID